jgi:hypothetical protein
VSARDDAFAFPLTTAVGEWERARQPAGGVEPPQPWEAVHVLVGIETSRRDERGHPVYDPIYRLAPPRVDRDGWPEVWPSAGDTLRIRGKRFEVLARDFDLDESVFTIIVREVQE